MQDCPPLVIGPVVAMRHAIACHIRAGLAPLPEGDTLTTIRQTWDAARCTAYIRQHGPAVDAPSPATLPSAFPVAPTAPAPAPVDAAGALLASLQAFVASTKPTADTPATAAALEALRAELVSVIETEAERVDDKIASAVTVWLEKFEALAARAQEVAPRPVVITSPDGTPRGKPVTNPHPLLETVCALVLAGKPVMLAGPAGAGKTYLAAQVAEALGLEFGLHGAAMMAHELTGFVDASGRFVDTVASRQFRQGGLTCFDEHDGGSESAPLVLNAMLANRVMAQGSAMVPAHPDWRVIATCNTLDGASAVYTGRVKLDGATLNRYFVLHVAYVPAIEESLAGGNDAWLALCRKARREIEGRGIPTVAGTYRDIETGAQLLASGMDLQMVARGLLCRGGLTWEALR